MKNFAVGALNTITFGLLLWRRAMKTLTSIRSSHFLFALLALTLSGMPRTVQAWEHWQATVGSQSSDMGRQALAFLPNEFWIHEGDSITWTWRTKLIHTLTFLTPGQPYPVSFTVGCPGFSSNPATFDGSKCVTTPIQVMGQTFTVQFPKAGNYKFECLVHLTMTGLVHVLPGSETLPHNQDFYNAQAAQSENRYSPIPIRTSITAMSWAMTTPPTDFQFALSPSTLLPDLGTKKQHRVGYSNWPLNGS